MPHEPSLDLMLQALLANVYSNVFFSSIQYTYGLLWATDDEGFYVLCEPSQVMGHWPLRTVCIHQVTVDIAYILYDMA